MPLHLLWVQWANALTPLPSLGMLCAMHCIHSSGSGTWCVTPLCRVHECLLVSWWCIPALLVHTDWHIQPRHIHASQCQGRELHWQCSGCCGHVLTVWRGPGRESSCVCPHGVAWQLSLFAVHVYLCVNCPPLVVVHLWQDTSTTSPCPTLKYIYHALPHLVLTRLWPT